MEFIILFAMIATFTLWDRDSAKEAISFGFIAVSSALIIYFGKASPVEIARWGSYVIVSGFILILYGLFKNKRMKTNNTH